MPQVVLNGRGTAASTDPLPVGEIVYHVRHLVGRHVSTCRTAKRFAADTT